VPTEDFVFALTCGTCDANTPVAVTNLRSPLPGSTFDELELNRVLCHHHGVRIAGVIVNKVSVEKYEQTKDYISRAMMQAWGVPMLGCIPDKPFLGCLMLADIERLFKTELICGADKRMQHYRPQDMNLATTSMKVFLENLRVKPSNTLYVSHVTRNDIIIGFLAEYQRRKHAKEPFESALIICGRKDKYYLSRTVKDMLVEGEAPVLFVELSTHQTMGMIRDFTPKLNIDDVNRVSQAINHYEPYIDFDELLRRTSTVDPNINEL